MDSYFLNTIAEILYCVLLKKNPTSQPWGTKESHNDVKLVLLFSPG